MSATFYAGVSNLEIGNTEKAIDLLSTVRMNSPTYYEDATWYLLLANLKLKNIEEVKTLSKELKSQRYDERVEKVLERIGS